MSELSTDKVVVTSADGIATITLAAPERLNAVDPAMLDAVADAVVALGEDPAARVIVLTGEGRGFCSGADLGSGDIAGDDPDTATLDAAARLIRALTHSSRPTVAAVNGVAAGVGCSLALACDYVLARESASFMLAFSKIGLMPDGGATLLVAASIGRARAVRMALTAEKVLAPTALEWGLIAEVAPDAAFESRVQQLATSLAAGPTRAYAATTAAINAATLADLDGALAREDEGQGKLLRSKDFSEGVAAFRERREASFTGSD
ncbi:enoyl-CoA hydratase-related protein [Arsenicicoccus piscis]|uniref:Enoyl-CoA hydratase n=1 Tax=Arsenicicoccus piscis TaxID=673954 RepID=A0ABQ6HSS9_9MICO|nr:enoyl-CoA hydratase-related protein [Arsenicicoccus piscis]MCH8627932.1 enoyl-CoA hydratase-related protein [Arsenicicoccus piscis]GMA20738.1 enoyl-CoA hydratase [Arsenicicoccus piscis]